MMNSYQSIGGISDSNSKKNLHASNIKEFTNTKFTDDPSHQGNKTNKDFFKTI